MAKLTNVRERVHQPFFDSLIRTAGFGGNFTPVQQRTDLFTIAGKNAGESNLVQGSVLPSDQSHVTLALRVFVWFKKPEIRGTVGGDGVLPNEGEVGNFLGFFGAGGPGAGESIAHTSDAYRLYWQSLEQIHWSYGTGQKFSIDNMASKYFPDGNGLHGDMGGASDLIHCLATVYRAVKVFGSP